MTTALRRPVVFHMAVNALLLWMAYYWLGVPESRATMLVWSSVLAVVIVELACWTYAAAFACLESNPWRTALRNLLPFTAVALGVVLLYLLLANAHTASARPASAIASWLTLQLRKPVRPQTVLAVFRAGLWLLSWVVIPVVVLPWMSAIARGAGLRPKGPPTRWYWMQAPVLLLLGLWLPLKILGWTPHAEFGVEVLSFALRATVAYFLFVGALLVLAFLTAGGKPRLTQSSTAVSP